MDSLARLLIAVDGSPQANAAVSLALRFAAAPRGTALRFVHVVDGDVLVAQCASGGLVASGAAEALEAAREGGRRIVVAALAAAREAGIEADGEVREGAPVDELLEAARGWKATCIVTGTHGRQGLARTLLGSRTETLLRHGTVPVLTVRASAPAAAVPCPRRIVCAVDESAPARAAFEAARGIAQARGAELIVLSVAAAGSSAAAQACLDRFSASADGLAVRAELVRAPAAGVAIPAHASELGADLIVLGTHGRDGVARAFLGSVAESVLRRSAVPVLTIGAAASAAGTRHGETTSAELASRRA
ncbi:MAG TPA: universal stress protein [Candidatus Limnocylindria bacterium]|nr:universal stress protein [Candidatus Limnocylindria bacterium]